MRNLILSSIALLSAAVTASAVPFTQEIVFGDSLSDGGNAYAIYLANPGLFPAGSAPIPPNYTRGPFGNAGRYTSGQDTSPKSQYSGALWVELTALKLGLSVPTPYLLTGGNNFAVASAETGSSSPQDMKNQLGIFSTKYLTGIPTDALYVIWGGSNDLLNAKSPTDAAAREQNALTNLYGEISGLAKAGAKYFLWADIPPVGSTPRATAEGSTLANALNTQASNFRQSWSTDIPLLEAQNPSITIAGLDTFALFEGIAGSNVLNTSTYAQGKNVNPDQYLFWDQEHPTAIAHALIAQGAVQSIDSAFASTATPEPNSFVFVLTAALLALAFLKRRVICQHLLNVRV